MGDIVFEQSTNKRKFVGFTIYQYTFDEGSQDFTLN